MLKAPAAAARYWLAAGRNDARRGAHYEAARLLQRALASIGALLDALSPGRLELEVHLALTSVLMAIGMGSERTLEVARRTIALCETLGVMDRALPRFLRGGVLLLFVWPAQSGAAVEFEGCQPWRQH